MWPESEGTLTVTESAARELYKRWGYGLFWPTNFRSGSNPGKRYRRSILFWVWSIKLRLGKRYRRSILFQQSWSVKKNLQGSPVLKNGQTSAQAPEGHKRYGATITSHDHFIRRSYVNRKEVREYVLSRRSYLCIKQSATIISYQRIIQNPSRIILKYCTICVHCIRVFQ